MSRRLFNKVAIIGVGLIGGSLGMVIKKKGLARQVMGLARRSRTIREAIRQRAVDKGTLDFKTAIQEADLVVLATPVETIISSVSKIKKFLKKGCIVIDVGSCKKKIVEVLERKLPKGIAFVGTHPLAGSEKKGVNFAQANLFEDTLCLLTPTSKTKVLALKKIKKLWQAVGAEVEILKPDTHDKILATVSHLPHVLAFSLIKSIPAGHLPFSPRSLKEITRIASSDPVLWKDVFFNNSGNVLKAIRDFQTRLNELKKSIARRDAAGTLRFLQQAKQKRDSI